MRRLSTLLIAMIFVLAVPTTFAANDKDYEQTDIITKVAKVIVQDDLHITALVLQANGTYRLKTLSLDGLFVSGKIIIKVDVPPDKSPWIKATGDKNEVYRFGYETIIIHIRSLDDLVLH